MKTIILQIALTYDEQGMYGNDPDGMDWFKTILGEGLELYSDEIGLLGEARVITELSGDNGRRYRCWDRCLEEY